MQAGGRLTTAVLDYIEASLFVPDHHRLATFLNDSADCERDSLLELIFFPDQAVQVDLEPLLSATGCSADDEKVLLDGLNARMIDATVRLPDGRPLTRIRLPDFIKSQYLVRLKIAWQLDPHVAAAIETDVSAARVALVKVRLRNAGVRLASHQRAFLCRFFERMADNDPDFLASLDLVLSLLEPTGKHADAYDMLVEHKRSQFRSLQQARRFETLLRRSNMETLMLQGVRAPHVSPNELMQSMRLIDLICMNLFGRCEVIAVPMNEPLREVANLDDPKAAVQSLLR
jgi:hypothetical protein